MLELYHDADSLCSFKVRMCLAEKNLAWTERRVLLGRFEHLQPAYLKLNPNGVVPTLVHDGEAIVESSMINEYLDETFSSPSLKPAQPLERARMRVWVKYQDDIVHHAVRPATFQLMIKQRVKALGREQVEALVASHPLPERAKAYIEWATGEIDYAAVRESVQKFRGIIERIERTVVSTGWLAGDAFSLAECAMAPFIDRVEHLGMARLWADRPRVVDWVTRVKARPAYSRAQPSPDGRLPSPTPEMLAATFAQE